MAVFGKLRFLEALVAESFVKVISSVSRIGGRNAALTGAAASATLAGGYIVTKYVLEIRKKVDFISSWNRLFAII